MRCPREFLVDYHHICSAIVSELLVWKYSCKTPPMRAEWVETVYGWPETAFRLENISNTWGDVLKRITSVLEIVQGRVRWIIPFFVEAPSNTPWVSPLSWPCLDFLCCKTNMKGIGKGRAISSGSNDGCHNWRLQLIYWLCLFSLNHEQSFCFLP